MPLYEYACARCGHELEARQRISDPPLLTCPSCGADALERLVSRSSFSLKGGGWYADGYGSGGSGESSSSAKKSSAPKADTSTSSTTSTTSTSTTSTSSSGSSGSSGD